MDDRGSMSEFGSQAAADRIEARVRAIAGEGDASTGVHGGTHVYGYARDAGECVLKRPGCVTVATVICHGRFACIPCLHIHKHELERDGVDMKFVGSLDDKPQAPGVDDRSEMPAQNTGEIHNPVHEPAWTERENADPEGV